MRQLPSRPGLYVVHDPSDALEHTRFLQRLARLEEGRVVCEITPGPRNADWLGKDLARALGKRPFRSGTRRSAQELWWRVAAWLSGERVRHLFVARAHLLGADPWTRLGELAACCGFDLWLVAQGRGLTRRQSDHARGWGFAALDFDGFRSRWSDVAYDPEQDPVSTRRLPRVPNDDFPSFRASCRELLTGEEHEMVDAAWTKTFLRTHSWAEASATDTTAVASYLRSLLLSSTDMQEMLVRLRAAQAALFHRGLFVKVNLHQLLAHADSAHLYTRLDRETAQRLRSYLSSRYAAIAALAVATRLHPAELARLRIQDVDPDGASVSFAADAWPIPDYAAGIVRAHLARRAQDGAGPEDALFVNKEGRWVNRPMREQYLKRTLRQVTVETSVAIVRLDPESLIERAVDEQRWLRRHGIVIKPLLPEQA